MAAMKRSLTILFMDSKKFIPVSYKTYTDTFLLCFLCVFILPTLVTTLLSVVVLQFIFMTPIGLGLNGFCLGHVIFYVLIKLALHPPFFLNFCIIRIYCQGWKCCCKILLLHRLTVLLKLNPLKYFDNYNLLNSRVYTLFFFIRTIL